MGQKTSVYLPDDLTAKWKASGTPLTELIRRGLDATEHGEPDLDAAALRRILREELAGLSLDAGSPQARYEPDEPDCEPFIEAP